MESLKQKTISGIGWSAVGSFWRQGLQFLISVILARLLTPEDFGLLGMIIVFTGIAQLFSELGFGAALIQKKELEERHLSSVFWLNLVVGLVLTILVYVSAPWIASFYNEPDLILLVRAISINFVISGFGIVHKNTMSRNMQFKLLAIVDLASTFITGIVTVIMAFSGYGVWSLVVQVLGMSLFSVLFMWYLGKWRPKLILQRAALKDMLAFSSNLLGAQLLNYGVRNFDYLLIGRYVGSSSLGIYTRAYTTMLLPINQITAVIGRVMFPALSQIQDDIQRIKRVYLHTIRIIGLLTIPLMCGMMVVARPFVLTIFGPKWEAVIPVLQILCFVGVKQPIGSTTGWIYQAKGRTDWMLRWNFVSMIITLIAFIIGIRWGIIGVATAYAIRSYVIWYPAITIPGRLINLTFWEFFKNVADVFACSIGMSLFVWQLGNWMPTSWPYWLQLIVQVTSGALTFLILVHVFKLQAYDEVRALIMEQLGKRKLTAVPKITNP